MQKNRREFLKKAGIAGAVAATAGVATETASNLKSGKSKKTEVLYKRSKNWDLYYEQAK